MGFYDYQVFSSWLNIVESWEIAFRRQAAMFGDDIVASWPQLLPIKCGPHDIRFAIVCSLSPSDFPPFGRKLERSTTRCFRQRAGAIKQISCLWKPTPFYSRCGFYPLVHCREDHLNVTQFTFMIISKCGFGFATSWTPPESGAMAFPEALRVVSETIVPRMVLPSWAYKLPVKRSAEDLYLRSISSFCLLSSSLRRIGDAWSIVASFISASIDTRRNDQMDGADLDDASLPGDILNRLVASNLGTQKYSLSEQEVVNSYLFFCAARSDNNACPGCQHVFTHVRGPR